MPYNVYVIRANGKVEHSTQPKAPQLAQLQAAVGGYIETVPYFTKYNGLKRGRAYANEEGLLKSLPYNHNASMAWKESYKFATGLVGDVIFYAKAATIKHLTEEQANDLFKGEDVKELVYGFRKGQP
jgi:hypothetical protein